MRAYYVWFPLKKIIGFFMVQNSVYTLLYVPESLKNIVYSAIVQGSLNIEWILLVNGVKFYIPDNFLSSWSVIERGVWSLQPSLWMCTLLPQVLSIFSSPILQFCCLEQTHLWLIPLPGRPTLLPLSKICLCFCNFLCSDVYFIWY